MASIGTGAIAGVVATLPMTAVILSGRKAGLLAVPPPKQITDSTIASVGETRPPRGRLGTATWMVAHLAYGAACGAIFAATRPSLPRSPAAAGLLFGGAVWAISYGPLLPSLDLYPSLTEDRPTRTGVMIAAHAVFGTALAALFDATAGDEQRDRR
jgi:hypothetical protein